MINTLSLTDIYKPVEQDLVQFQSALKEELSSKDTFVQSLTDYLLHISGKHLRPALAILTSRLGNVDSNRSIQLAIAIELLHTATLIHDDIVDESMFRRNQESMNSKWGNDVSIICGDFVYAKAFKALTSLGDHRINQMFGECAINICEGEMKQIETRAQFISSEPAYYDMIWKKTAALFEAACLAGGYLAQLNPTQLMHVAKYGKNLGLAFQIVDDCMDIVGEEEHLGKKAGLDFEKQDPTLPLIFLAQTLKSDAVLNLSNGNGEKKHSFEEIKELVIEHKAVDKAIEKAKEFGSKASENIQFIPDSPVRKSLSDLVDYTLQRVA